MPSYPISVVLVASMFVLWVPGALQAQTATPAKLEAKPAANSSTSPRPPQARPAAKALEAVTPLDDDPKIQLTAQDLEIAKQVFVGRVPCELGAFVTITPARREGLFVVQAGKVHYLMHPVSSRTGAIRLEDPRHGAMWLQLGNKSMLMNQKLGARLADECMSPAQVAFADQMKKNPARSLLDGPEPASAATPESGAAAPSVTR